MYYFRGQEEDPTRQGEASEEAKDPKNGKKKGKEKKRNLADAYDSARSEKNLARNMSGWKEKRRSLFLRDKETVKSNPSIEVHEEILQEKKQKETEKEASKVKKRDMKLAEKSKGTATKEEETDFKTASASSLPSIQFPSPLLSFSAKNDADIAASLSSLPPTNIPTPTGYVAPFQGSPSSHPSTSSSSSVSSFSSTSSESAMPLASQGRASSISDGVTRATSPLRKEKKEKEKEKEKEKSGQNEDSDTKSGYVTSSILSPLSFIFLCVYVQCFFSLSFFSPSSVAMFIWPILLKVPMTTAEARRFVKCREKMGRMRGETGEELSDEKL